MSFSGGVFSINTSGQPVVAGTTISASVFNALTSDLATGLSTCMLKDGTQTATAGIGFYAGTVSLPGIYFGTDTATGLYRIGLNNTGYAINGTKLLDLSSATVGITGVLTVSSTVTLGASAEKVIINRVSDGTTYGSISFNGVVTAAGMAGFYGRGSSSDSGTIYGNVPTGASYKWAVNNSQQMILSGSALTLDSLSGTGSRAVNADASGVLSAASDSRLKQEVPDAPIPGIDEIMQIQPKAYKWLDDIAKRGDEAAVEIGFFANQVAPIIPSAAPIGRDGYYGFYDRSVTAALVKAVQQQELRIRQLESK